MKTQYEDMFDYYKHTSMFWNDMIAMMSSKRSALMAVGPLRNFTENIKKISQELIEANQEIVVSEPTEPSELLVNVLVDSNRDGLVELLDELTEDIPMME